MAYNNRAKTAGAFVFFAVLFSFCGFVYLLSTNKIAVAYNDGYQPEQPLPFSHALHAGRYKMDCRYCHTEVEQGRHAGVPSLDICMNCHLTVKTNSPWIKKLTQAYQNKQPIVWEKVHLLPDFVKFNHSLHLNKLAGGLHKGGLPFVSGENVRKTCTTCHGPVESMEEIYQHSPLSMGWCVQCHRKEENKAPVNCSTCHY